MMRPTLRSSASITLDGDTLVYRSSYDPQLVAALKSQIPAIDRKWEPARKCWLVAPEHGDALAEITERYLGITVTVPAVDGGATEEITRILDVRYIGTTKDRGDGERTAFGWVAGEWSVIFPEQVLRDWFGAKDTAPDEQVTLYATLGLKRNASGSQVKSAYRRMARSWHPDTCKEPGAHEQFIRIQHAYEVLRNPAARARYDAGLELEASARTQPVDNRWEDYLDTERRPKLAGYRSPLRCGLIMALGVESLGRFVVNEIHAWEDITDSEGRVLVTSWPMGAEIFEEEWV